MLLLVFEASSQTVDSTQYSSMADFLRHGKASGSTRVYYMATDNAGVLSDYHGLGIGAGIGYQTPQIKGFSAAMSGSFILNAFSSDFTVTDSITQNPNRYELGLFDVTDPANKSNLYRLENMWIQYKYKTINLKYGQYVPKNIFVNAQDGRMNPTMVRGIQTNLKLKDKQLSLEYIHHISPRSTVKWYSVAESIGIYPKGLDVNGKPSTYLGQLKSPGLVMAHLNGQIKKTVNYELGLVNILSIANTYYGNLAIGRLNWYLKAMAIFQEKGNGSTAPLYMADNHTSVWSASLGRKVIKIEGNINFTQISNAGRFLMPREWGREPFYTFMPRERNEGMGGTKAISANVIYKIKPNFDSKISIGHFELPDTKNYRLNKYAMPSYNQINIESNLKLTKWWEGTSFKFLYVRKNSVDRNIENPKEIFNKVNLNIYNIIFNYTF